MSRQPSFRYIVNLSTYLPNLLVTAQLEYLAIKFRNRTVKITQLGLIKIQLLLACHNLQGRSFEAS